MSFTPPLWTDPDENITLLRTTYVVGNENIKLTYVEFHFYITTQPEVICATVFNYNFQSGTLQWTVYGVGGQRIDVVRWDNNLLELHVWC